MSFQTAMLAANVVVIPLVTYLFRGWLKQFTQRLDGLETWRRTIDAAMDAKVSREDFIREASRNRQTLEKLLEGQARLEGKLDAGARIAASLEQMNERLNG